MVEAIFAKCQNEYHFDVTDNDDTVELYLVKECFPYSRGELWCEPCIDAWRPS
jgi:hypothetical protein